MVVSPSAFPSPREPQRDQIILPSDHRARRGRPIGEPSIQSDDLCLARLRSRVVDYRRPLRVCDQIRELRPFARRQPALRERPNNGRALAARRLALGKPFEQLRKRHDGFCIVLCGLVDAGEQPHLVGVEAFNRRDEPREIAGDPPRDLGDRFARRPFVRRKRRVGAQRERRPQQVPSLAIVIDGVSAPVHRRAPAAGRADRFEKDHDPRRQLGEHLSARRAFGAGRVHGCRSHCHEFPPQAVAAWSCAAPS
jgi:hypothetical protein